MFTTSVMILGLNRPWERALQPSHELSHHRSSSSMMTKSVFPRNRTHQIKLPGRSYHVIIPAGDQAHTSEPVPANDACANSSGMTIGIPNAHAPSESFCESLHLMHDIDHAGLVLVSEPPDPAKIIRGCDDLKQNVNHVDVPKDNCSNSQYSVTDFSIGISNCSKLGINRTDRSSSPKSKQTALDEDGDCLVALQEKISQGNKRHSQIMEQIAVLEEKKRRYQRTSRQNIQRIGASERKRKRMEELAESKVKLCSKQVTDLEAEKTEVGKKLEKAEEVGVALAMQKEEINQCLLTIINSASAVYQRECQEIEERHQREDTKFRYLLGVFLTLCVVLVTTFMARFEWKPEEPPPPPPPPEPTSAWSYCWKMFEDFLRSVEIFIYNVKPNK